MKRINNRICFAVIVMIFAALFLTGCSQKNAETATNNVVGTESPSVSTESPSDIPATTPGEAQATGTPDTTLLEEQTEQPTEAPTPEPTVQPTEAPTVDPTEKPESEAPVEPTGEPVDAATPEAPKEPSNGMFDPWYSVQTSIAYSSGTDSDWSYGNQRKEFTVTKPCYVRIGSSIVADWHWGWRYGEGKAITITYRFTGAQNCNIEISDGFVTTVESDDPNVLVFTRTLTAKGSHEEDVVVFRYDPSQVGSVSLEVIYDENIKSQYDERNTVYFIEEEW